MKPKCSFTLQKSERSGRPYYHIRAIVYVNGSRALFNTGLEIKRREHWNNGRVVGTEPYLSEIYYNLRKIKEEVEVIKIDQSSTPQMVISEYSGKYEVNSPRTLLGVIDFYINLKNEDPTIAPNTVKEYSSVRNRVSKWLEHKGWPDIPLRALRRDHIREYVSYIGEINGSKNISTAYYHYGIIKSAIDTAIIEFMGDSYMIRYNPITGAVKKPDQKEMKRITMSNNLTEEQIEMIKDSSVRPKNTGRGRNTVIDPDWFKQVVLFQIYSGFSFVDMGHDNWSIIKMMDGTNMILLNRGKNGQEAHIPITNELKDVIKRLRGFGGERLFPFPVFINPMNYKEKDESAYTSAYANYRNYLKRLSKHLKLKAPIKSHTLRHTFAMLMMNKHGMSIESIASMLGHSNINTTQQNYAYVTQQRVANEFLQKNERIQNYASNL